MAAHRGERWNESIETLITVDTHMENGAQQDAPTSSHVPDLWRSGSLRAQ